MPRLNTKDEGEQSEEFITSHRVTKFELEVFKHRKEAQGKYELLQLEAKTDHAETCQRELRPCTEFHENLGRPIMGLDPQRSQT